MPAGPEPRQSYGAARRTSSKLISDALASAVYPRGITKGHWRRLIRISGMWCTAMAVWSGDFMIHSPLAAQLADPSFNGTFTEPQRNAAIAVQEISDRLTGGDGVCDGLSATDTTLCIRTTELVHTANDIRDRGPQDLSLGLDREGLQFALQWVAHEDVGIQGSTATEGLDGQSGGLGARLDALRAGATGFQLAGLSLNTRACSQ